MSVIETHIDGMAFNRTRTLASLERAETLGSEALGWRPAAGRAHIAWQLMHIAITEELFATERLRPEREPRYSDFWERFRGGSTPDDEIPTGSQIRDVLANTRESLLETLRSFSDSQLDEIVFPERKWQLRTVLHVLSWHESHHQGQAHITLNMFDDA